MIAAALAINPDALTQERPLPWKPTSSESVEVFRVLERYARGGIADRIRAASDMDQIITRVAMRACEQVGKAGTK